MAEFLLARWKEEKALKKSKKSKSKGKHKDETPDERKARTARKKEKKAKKDKAKKDKSEGMKGVEDLLASLGRREQVRTGPGQGTPLRDDDKSRYGSGSRSRTPRGYGSEE